jgi:hypothetical protein
MKIHWRQMCPNCGFSFPLLWGVSVYRVRRGYFSTPGLKCPDCGTISRQAVSWDDAVWAWPLALLIITWHIALFRGASFLVHLHRSHPALHGALAGLGTFPFFLALRLGLKLVPVSEVPASRRKALLKNLTAGGCLIAAAVIIGLFTHRWASLGVGLGVATVIWIPLYFSAKNRMETGHKPH